jgi:hypothetical protein
MEQNDKIALIGLSIIAVSAANFLDNPWSWLGTIEFTFVCFGVSYLIRKIQDDNKITTRKRRTRS